MLGKRVTFATSSDSGTTWDVVAQVISMNGIDFTRETNDVTPYGGADDFRQYDYGMADAGELEITLLYDAAQAEADALLDDLVNGVLSDVQITFPAPFSATVTGQVLVTSAARNFPRDEQITRNFTLKWTGLPVTV